MPVKDLKIPTTVEGWKASSTLLQHGMKLRLLFPIVKTTWVLPGWWKWSCNRIIRKTFIVFGQVWVTLTGTQRLLFRTKLRGFQVIVVGFWGVLWTGIGYWFRLTAGLRSFSPPLCLPSFQSHMVPFPGGGWPPLLSSVGNRWSARWWVNGWPVFQPNS